MSNNTESATVTDLSERRHQDVGRPNLRCRCGGEWWVASICLDAETRAVVGRGARMECADCGERVGQ